MDRMIASQSATIASLESQILSNEKLIAMHEATNVSLEAEISTYKKTITEQEATIASQASEVSSYLLARDATIENVLQELALLKKDIQTKIVSY
jgi:predicted RNase H-like nuclease (RuvC/YqgF family)